MLAQFDIEQKQAKALSQITEAQSLFFRALSSLEDDHINKRSLAETINEYVLSMVNRGNKYLDHSNTVDVIDVEGS